MSPPPLATTTKVVSVVFFLALLASVLVCSALKPPPASLPDEREGTREETEGWGVSLPAFPAPLPRLALPEPASSSDVVPVASNRRLLSVIPAEEILSQLEGDQHGRFILALSNGTVYLINKHTGSRWKLLIGAPLLFSWRDPSTEDELEHYVYPHEDGNLYEHNKDSGIRQHNLSIEDYVDQTPIFKNSTLTIGKKESFFYVVRADSGELVYMGNSPFAWSRFGMQPSEVQPIPSKLESSDANYITIVRTDYSLLSSDVSKSKDLWSVKVSRISAYDVGQPPVGYEMQMSPISDPFIPVYILGETAQTSQKVPMVSALPSLPTPKISYRNVKKQDFTYLLDVVCKYQNSCLTETGTNSSMETDQRRKRMDNEFGPICSSGVFSDPTDGGPLDNCINEGPNLTAQPIGSTGPELISEISMNLTYDKRSSTRSLQKLSGHPSNYSGRNNYLAQQHSRYMPSFLFGAFFLFALLFMLIKVLYQRFRNQYNVCKESNDVKERQSIVPRRRKSRKAGNSRSGAPNSILVEGMSLENGNSEHDAYNQSPSNGFSLLGTSVEGIDAKDGRWVGKLFVLNSVIGRGSNGTVVFEGIHDGRSVAVKRLLRAHNDVALKEIENLIASDQHPNIVRWHGVEQDIDFVYISLERCRCSLSDLIQKCSDISSNPMSTPCAMPNSLFDQKNHLNSINGFGSDVILWTEKGLPSSHILKLMRDIVSGLAHLHEIGIIHRDLKPQNVLISKDRRLNAKLSDMGISKRLLDDMSCLSHNATGCGSSGWRAPEQLLHGRQTRAVDLFSLGCILFFCITKGKHPFGNHYDRDSNIVNNRVDLFLVDHIPEAEHLISKLLDPDPKMRPSAVEALNHPLFWSSEMRLSFLRDVSDRVELEDRENGSELLTALENTASAAFGGKWNEKLDRAFISDMGRYRKYKFESVRDLLRVTRNKLNHYRELTKELQETLGPVPDGFDTYFASRFPKLLIEAYKVICSHCREEYSFNKYFKSDLI